MAHDSHHSAHEVGGHEEHNDSTKAPHAGFYEVPMALGVFFWALVLVIINIINCSCDEGGSCCVKEEGGHGAKTEMHSSGH